MNLRQHVRDLQIIENEAAEKAGMRFLLSMDEEKLLGSHSEAFIAEYIELLTKDILPEVKRAGEAGKELREEVFI